MHFGSVLNLNPNPKFIFIFELCNIFLNYLPSLIFETSLAFLEDETLLIFEGEY
jgi:hypothetical protein